MSLFCHECGSTDIRIAHFRFGDALRLFIFRYPVRCRDCKNRWYAPIALARELPRPQNRRGRVKKAV
jgi:hypothetical protein